MKKSAERINVITESENKNFVHAIINAVTKGYSDRIIFDDIVDLVRRKEISKGVLTASPDALRAYGDSFKKSLSFLADHIDKLEVNDELTVKLKEKAPEENVLEEELEKIEEVKEPEKKEASVRFANLVVSEDFEKYAHDEKSNKISGIIVLKFNQDMSKYKKGDEIKLSQHDVDNILGKIFGYCKTEYKNLKANLDTKIFKTNIRFASVEKGEAEVEYEIIEAF
jgi:hypothetical protein